MKSGILRSDSKVSVSGLYLGTYTSFEVFLSKSYTMSRSICVRIGCYEFSLVCALQVVIYVGSAQLSLEDGAVSTLHHVLVVREALVHVQVGVSTDEHCW